MSDKYQPLRAAISAGPTKGPWLTNAPDEIEGQFFVVTMARDGDERRIVCKVNNFISGRPLEDEDIASAAYIAAADPDTIAALLRERDALRAVVKRVVEIADSDPFQTVGFTVEHVVDLRAAVADGEASNAG